jgi:hypothetical protein
MLASIRTRPNKFDTKSGELKVMRTVLFSWVMLSMVVGVAAASSGRNCAWLLLALVISPLVARLLLLALPNLKTGRQWQASIQALVGFRPRNSKGAARMSTFAAGTLTADRIDYWIRRRVLQYWDGAHPSQRLLNAGRDRRVGLSTIRHDRYREGINAP